MSSGRLRIQPGRCDSFQKATAPRPILLLPDEFKLEMRGCMSFDRASALRSAQGDVLARDPRFAIGIYQAAVATGAMDSVRLRR
jgi:hypothetical protein